MGNDTPRFGVTVRAESIPQAVKLAEASCPNADARVVHPIKPEVFVRDPASTAGLVEIRMPQSAAG